jgi:hypothetical protein
VQPPSQPDFSRTHILTIHSHWHPDFFPFRSRQSHAFLRALPPLSTSLHPLQPLPPTSSSTFRPKSISSPTAATPPIYRSRTSSTPSTPQFTSALPIFQPTIPSPHSSGPDIQTQKALSNPSYTPSKICLAPREPCKDF